MGVCSYASCSSLTSQTPYSFKNETVIIKNFFSSLFHGFLRLFKIFCKRPLLTEIFKLASTECCFFSWWLVSNILFASLCFSLFLLTSNFQFFVIFNWSFNFCIPLIPKRAFQSNVFFLEILKWTECLGGWRRTPSKRTSWYLTVS